MASALLENLSAASTLAASDLFYVKQAGARGLKATGTQLLALVGTTYVPLAGGTMTGALTIASGTLTASAPALNITQTWNQSGVAFVGALWSFTKTAADASYPLLIRVDGSNIFSLDHTGFINAHSFKGNLFVGQSEDVPLVRDAAAQLALRNGTTAQRMHIYGTYTDSSNYERLTLSTTAGTSVNIAAETLGTGGDNLDIVLTPAGTGVLKFGTHSALAAETVQGYITIKDSGGTTRKLAVVA